jgi:oligopeptide/dipeptide ABC transporter ATP-binding protein
MAANDEDLLQIRNLSVNFVTSLGVLKRNKVTAVDNVSLSVKKGESLGVVGESGSGKTTLARSIVMLLRPSAGNIIFDGKDIVGLRSRSLKQYRQRVQMIFQDPYESLNPRTRVKDIIEEPMIIHEIVKDKKARKDRVNELLKLAGLNPATVARKYPHELSGGERQRISLARALSLHPELLIADEPVSMLDVSIRIGIINLMLDLKRSFNLSYLFITHDLGLARYFCDRIGVMYRGKIVEIAATEDLLHRPMHPYTKLLIDSVPGRGLKEEANGGQVSQDVRTIRPEIITGCRFNPRCEYAQRYCREKEPELLEVEPGHFVACHFPLNKTPQLVVSAS